MIVIVAGKQAQALAQCVAALETLKARRITIRAGEGTISAWLPGRLGLMGGEIVLRVVSATPAWQVEVEGAGVGRVRAVLQQEDERAGVAAR